MTTYTTPSYNNYTDFLLSRSLLYPSTPVVSLLFLLDGLPLRYPMTHHLLTCNHLPTNLSPAHPPTHLPVHPLTDIPTYSSTHSPILPLTRPPTHRYSHLLVGPPTLHLPVKSLTH